ncbi:MAG: deoxyribonuclease IV [Desulfobulbaceae bacterium]|nr:MAG: deoxyribonuclease IV [Desulfobulbaceae bacterium]
MFLGAHMSVAGGLYLAIERIRRVAGTALQIFSRNQRQWQAKPISTEEAELFGRAWREWGDYPVAVHASYLINLAADKPEMRRKSIKALAAELQRTQALAIPHIILHPGSHGGLGSEAGVARVAASLDEAFALVPEAAAPMILLETTAGQGTALGSTFEELAAIRAAGKNGRRLGVCLDTCHIFAAGYDIGSAQGYEQTMVDFDRIIGLRHLHFIHVNDSKKPLASRVDRHDHIGAGAIGLKGFRMLMTDARLQQLPKTLETPKGEDLAEDLENLRILRELAAGGVTGEP